MAKKKSKLSTPQWILEGYDSPEDYEKAKGVKKKVQKKKGDFAVKVCPECGSNNVKVVIGEIGMWNCSKCKWKGKDVEEQLVSEEEYFKILDKMDSEEK